MLDVKWPRNADVRAGTHWWLAAVFWPLAVLGILAGLAGVGLLFVVGLLFLIVAIWGSVGCCCQLKLRGDFRKCGPCGPWRFNEDRVTPCC